MSLKKQSLLYVFATTLFPFNAFAALYEIPSFGINPDLYLNESKAGGGFNSFGTLPQGAKIMSASVQFLFQDDADGLRRFNYNHHPEIGGWVEQPPVSSGTDIHYIQLRSYTYISESLWGYDRESVDVSLNGLRIGSAASLPTTTKTSSTTPVGWQWDHGGSTRYVYSYDSNGRPIFGTKYFDYYNDVANVDRNTYWGNETDFSLTSAIDDGLFALLESGGILNFSLDVTMGDLLFKSASLFIETFNESSVPEPPPLILLLPGLLAAGWVRRRKNPNQGAQTTASSTT